MFLRSLKCASMLRCFPPLMYYVYSARLASLQSPGLMHLIALDVCIVPVVPTEATQREPYETAGEHARLPAGQGDGKPRRPDPRHDAAHQGRGY